MQTKITNEIRILVGRFKIWHFDIKERDEYYGEKNTCNRNFWKNP